MMKAVPMWTLVVVACSVGERSATSDTATSDTATSHAVVIQTPPASVPAQTHIQELKGLDTVSTAAGAYDDSVLANGRGDQIIVTTSGDTIQYIGGTTFDVDGTDKWGAEHYRKNSVQYLQITFQTGYKPNGRAIKTTKARVRLPTMTASQELILEGLCRVDQIRDPLIIAIATVPEGETYGPASSAWRYNPSTERLTQISPSNVTCAHVVVED
jgi:hypothetical protein